MKTRHISSYQKIAECSAPIAMKRGGSWKLWWITLRLRILTVIRNYYRYCLLTQTNFNNGTFQAAIGPWEWMWTCSFLPLIVILTGKTLVNIQKFSEAITYFALCLNTGDNIYLKAGKSSPHAINVHGINTTQLRGIHELTSKAAFSTLRCGC